MEDKQAIYLEIIQLLEKSPISLILFEVILMLVLVILWYFVYKKRGIRVKCGKKVFEIKILRK